ncbi:MAG: putative Extracellular solute-binding protein family 5 [Candidatus Saccharibacteria bacterium]|jgi:peptide/nickel transport system substrate-binding protein|nr:putative Extracellular solute-binding protein family 5 [Candidatus Saccharibacteria bacterium]
MFNYLRFRYRRAVRRIKRDARLLRKWTANYIDRHIWGKWHQLRFVRRFLLLWWAIAFIAVVGLLQQIGLLQRAASFAVAQPGGTYTEAAVGTVQTLNPLLPESATAQDINRLIFSGLTRYDAKRQLQPDLAEKWDVSADGRVYTFHLRKGVKWHDGVPFSAADVAFTLTAIQNPDSRSPLASSWQGVKFEQKGDHVITITIPQPLASFMDSTTLGIVPRHRLENVEPSLLREADFNQSPVGTGPFKMKTFAPSAREVLLSANPEYHFGQPKLESFMFRFYDSSDETLRAYAAHQVTSPGRIRPESVSSAEQLSGLTQYSYTLPEVETLFFSNTDAQLKDGKLRQILTRSLDRRAILEEAAAGQGVVVTQPLLPGQIGYTAKYALDPLTPGQAKKALFDGGYKPENLRFKLVTLEGGELERAAREIKRQWDEIGVIIEVVTADRDDLQQSYMRPRNFQMLLYGVNIGPDPDVYSYWHTSQAKDPGVNLSGYSSNDADRALEAGRIKTDEQVRQGKYDAFLAAWNPDAPAAVLYQSAYVYAARDEVAGIRNAMRLVVPGDRFYGVEKWTVRQRFVPMP